MEKRKQRRNHTNVKKYHGLTYTAEQKIIATVWYHERLFTGISYDQLCQNFRTRFDLEYPSYNTLKRWEQKLFKAGGESQIEKAKKVKNSGRWVYIPYIKESLIRYPDMTLDARSKFLGIGKSLIHTILKQDLQEYHLALLKNVKTENVAETSDANKKQTEKAGEKNS